VKKRPFLDEFLERASSEFNICIYTASKKEYADPVIDLIDKNFVITKRLFRESCIKTEEGYIKDLAKVDPDLNKVILIDNADISAALNPDNFLPIKSWFSADDDEELIHIMNIMTTFAIKRKKQTKQDQADVRAFLKSIQS